MSMLRPVTMPVLLTDAMLELLDFHVTFELLPLPFTVARSPTVSPIAVPVLVRLRRIVGFLQPLKLYSVLLYNRRKYNVYPFSPEMHKKLPCPHLSGTDMGVFLSPADADATDFSAAPLLLQIDIHSLFFF